MLEHLHISNLALIEDMSLDFEPGLNVLTGETGAGKSFILKALGFVLGDKLDAGIVRPGAERARVEALFRCADQDLILRRELLAATGRSRFYINDALASQDTLRELAPKLISHASQHAQQQLLQPAYQHRLLEQNIGNLELFAQKDELLKKLKALAAEIDALQAKQKTLAEKRELLEMQKMEIDKVSPAAGEEEKLEEMRAEVKANVAAKQSYNHAVAILHGDDGPGLIQMLQDLERIVGSMAGMEASLSGDREQIGEFRQYLTHLASTLPKPQSRHDVNMNMDAIEARLFAFAQLKRKLKRSLPEILALKNEIQENLSFLDVCALDMARLNKNRYALEKDLIAIVEKIKPLRQQSAELFCRNLENELRDLGFSEQVKVFAEFAHQEIWPGVQDEKGRISWAPNPGQKPQPLDKIASGGELSRFLLAINSLSAQKDDVTFIFDEVDAGVGGLTLNMVAEKLEHLAASHQIILITHWPQLAARAKKHFNISKTIRDGNTFTQCLPLDLATRKQELARMAGGGKEGETLAESLLRPKQKICGQG